MALIQLYNIAYIHANCSPLGCCSLAGVVVTVQHNVIHINEITPPEMCGARHTADTISFFALVCATGRI